MKTLIAMLGLLLVSPLFAGEPATSPDHASHAAAASPGVHRYLVERTFPAGALEGLDARTKAHVNAQNATVGVRWVESFANADKTKTYCIYEGPSEEAVRKAAALNKLPVDKVTEVPVTLLPK